MTQSVDMEWKKRVHVLNHPLLVHGLSQLRDRNTPQSVFRAQLAEISRLMAYESSADLKMTTKKIETPFVSMDAPVVAETVSVVAILRAGLGMLDGFMHMFPMSSVGHIGIYRDKYLDSTIEYYFRIPADIEHHKVFLLDPLLATGATLNAAIVRLKQCGVKDLRVHCLLACEEGLKKLLHTHPDISIYCLSIEPSLNEASYLLPGLGDAGERLYGTK